MSFDDEISFTEEGEYVFRLTEVSPADDDPDREGIQSDGVTYDQSAYEVVATVSDRGGERLSVAWSGDVDATFVNSYEPDPEPAPEPEPEPGPDPEPEPEPEPTPDPDPESAPTPGPSPTPDSDPTGSGRPSGGHIPQTGDAAGTAIPLIALVGAGAAGAGITIRRRRK